MTHRFLLRLPDAIWADISDTADARGRSSNDEILSRLMNPSARTTPPEGPYEGTHSLEVLALRGEPEDFGPMIEYWRAKRDISRKWLAKELNIGINKLAAIETAYLDVSDEERDWINEKLAWLDWEYPHLQEKTKAITLKEQPRQYGQDLAELDALDIDSEIEWMNPEKSFFT